MKKGRWGLGLMVVGLLLGAGCADLPLSRLNFLGISVGTLLQEAQIVGGLLSPERAANEAALTQLSDKYGVDVTTPTRQFMAAAQELATALRALKAAMAAQETEATREVATGRRPVSTMARQIGQFEEWPDLEERAE